MPHSVRAPEPEALRAAGLDPARARRLQIHLGQWLQDGRVPGLGLQVRRGGRVLDWHAGTLGHGEGNLDPGTTGPEDRAWGPDTRVRHYSLTKPFTAALMGRLLAQGHWRLDDPAARWLPEMAGMRVGDTGRPPHRPPTMADLLLHTAGLAYGLPGGDEWDRRYAAAGVLDPTTSLDTLAARLAHLPLAGEPGRPRYSIAHDLLGLAAQRMAGEPFPQALQRQVLKPFGLQATGFGVARADARTLAALHAHDDDGRAFRVAAGGALAGDPRATPVVPPPTRASGGGGLVGTLDDLGRFAASVAAEVAAGAATATLLTRAMHPTDDLLPGTTATLGGWTRIERPEAAGLRLSPGTLLAHGAGGGFLWIDPAEDLVVCGLLSVIRWSAGPPPWRQLEPLVMDLCHPAEHASPVPVSLSLPATGSPTPERIP